MTYANKLYLEKLKADLAEMNKIDEENSELFNKSYHAWQFRLHTAVRRVLGEEANLLKRVNAYPYEGKTNSVDLTFGTDDRRTFNITIGRGGIESYSISGLSGRPDRGSSFISQADLSLIAVYYLKVNEMLTLFAQPYSDIWSEVDSYKAPELKRYEGSKSETLEKIRELENAIKTEVLPLFPGSKMELLCWGLGRYQKNTWRPCIVERVTEKRIYLNCAWLNAKSIAYSEASERLRPVTSIEKQ